MIAGASTTLARRSGLVSRMNSSVMKLARSTTMGAVAIVAMGIGGTVSTSVGACGCAASGGADGDVGAGTASHIATIEASGVVAGIETAGCASSTVASSAVARMSSSSIRPSSRPFCASMSGSSSTSSCNAGLEASMTSAGAWISSTRPWTASRSAPTTSSSFSSFACSAEACAGAADPRLSAEISSSRASRSVRRTATCSASSRRAPIARSSNARLFLSAS